MIRKLEQSVINKIAAGEVIQRPYNVIKELTENAIDAGATQVYIKIEQGGLAYMEISDNGSGISVIEYPLLCERFATSKLSEISDLQTLDSFGFRGEALASLSYVCDLQIISKYKEASIGYKCNFRNEKMIDEPIPYQHNGGTKVIIRSLFQNLEARRSSMSSNEEKKKIYRLVSHFALHNYNIKFVLQSEKGTQFASDWRGNKASEAMMHVFQMITHLPFDKFIYFPVEVVENAKVEGIMTKLNAAKGKTLLLNINNRIVENVEITRTVQRAYGECYQSIHQQNQYFFVYLRIALDPKQIDCNQHPSKKTIGLFGADWLYEQLCKLLVQRIKQQCSIRTLTSVNQTQMSLHPYRDISQLTKKDIPQSQVGIIGQGGLIQNGGKDLPILSQQINSKPLYDYNKNRTDAAQLPLNFFIRNHQKSENRLSFVPHIDHSLEIQQTYIREFFQHLSYVGCFNLNYIFVHFENKLYMLNILPFVEPFIEQWLLNSQLMIYELPSERWIALGAMIDTFVQTKNLSAKVDVPKIIERVMHGQKPLEEEFGIKMRCKDRKIYIISYPTLSDVFAENISQIDLAYLLCRLHLKEPTASQRSQYLITFLASQFQEPQSPCGQHLSPLNDKYSQFMQSNVIPLLKTKCQHFKPTTVTNYLSQMLDLKDVYKIFQRC